MSYLKGGTVDFSHGVKGSSTYADTDAHTGDWYAIAAPFGDVVIASITLGDGHDGGASWASATISQGGRIDGVHITGITLTSGTVVLWKRTVGTYS